MIGWLIGIEACAPRFALASTVLLAVAALYVWLAPQPVDRERGARLGLGLAVVAGILACVPLPWPGAAPQVTDVASELAFVEGSFPWLGAVLFTGWLAVTIRFVVSCLGLARLVRDADGAPDELRALVDECGGLGVECVVSSRVTRPFCFGLGVPTIVLPTYLVAQPMREVLASVVRHELAHVLLGHAVGRVQVTLAQLFLFWNPLAWWLGARQQAVAELLADDAAATSVGKDPYVRALVELAHLSVGARPSALSLAASGNSAASLESRLRTLLERDERLRPNSSAKRTLVRLGAGLALVTLAGWSLGARPRVALATDASSQAYMSFESMNDAELGTLLGKLADKGTGVVSVELQPTESGGHHDAVVGFDRRFPAHGSKAPTEVFLKVFPKSAEARAEKERALRETRD